MGLFWWTATVIGRGPWARTCIGTGPCMERRWETLPLSWRGSEKAWSTRSSIGWLVSRTSP